MNGAESQLQWIDEQRPELTRRLQKWGNINTHTDNISGIETFASLLSDAFASLNVPVVRLALQDRQIVNDSGQVTTRLVGPALTCRSEQLGTGLPRVFLGIHMDTVYPTDHAFQQVTMDGDTMRGPGVADAKGGLLVLLTALQAFARSPLKNALQWEVLINPDEEVGSPSSAHLFTAAAKRNDFGLIYEPALPGGMLASARRGSGNWTLVARGRAAHAGRDPQNGRNAINAVAQFIAELESFGRGIAGASINMGMITGGGPVNVVPDFALCRFNVRVDGDTEQAAIERGIAELMERVRQREGITLLLHGGFSAPPKPTDAATRQLLEAARDCGSHLGITIDWKSTGGVCDGNRLAAAGLPALDNLGVRGGEIHSDREFCEISSIAERAKLTTLLLMKIATRELQPLAPSTQEERR